METVSTVRNIDPQGRLVVPKSVRKYCKIKLGDQVEISVSGDNIILERYRPQCVFCSSTGQVVEFKDRFICAACLK